MEMALVNRFVASCAETRELLSDYVEGELQSRTRRRVVRHLLMCRRCRAVLRSLRATIAGLNTLGRTEPPPDPTVADSVIARVRSEHDGGGGP
jgi:predicted anti-sigma-YlaC factor YlaD